MRLVTVVRVTKDGVSGESTIVGEVSEGYSEEQIARRVIKQFRYAKEDWIAGSAAQRAALAEKERIKRLQMPMFAEMA